MSTAAPQSWTCGFCGRSVPGRVDECYCGRKRPRAAPEPIVDTRRNLRFLVPIVGLALATAISFLATRRGAEPVAKPAAVDNRIALPASTDPAVTAPVSDEVMKTAFSAVVLIETMQGRGTGFFSAADVVTTARGLVGQQKTASVTLPDGRQFEATVIAVADQPRLVQLRVMTSSTSWLPPSPIRDARTGGSAARLSWAQPGERGTVKGLRRDQGVDVFETDVVLHTEDEGAAVIDRTGRALGVVSGHRIVAFDSARPYFRAP